MNNENPTSRKRSFILHTATLHKPSHLTSVQSHASSFFLFQRKKQRALARYISSTQALTFMLVTHALITLAALPATSVVNAKLPQNKALSNRNRRWDALMQNCIGTWSGTIGWYDVAITENQTDKENIEYKLVQRSDSNTRNMRLSFQTRPQDKSTADWVVYHAKGWGVREEVVLQSKETNNGDLPLQTFYSFQGGNLGRSGKDFLKLPVIEHGFWNVAPNGSGDRRTVVVVYNPDSGHLIKVCYLYQKRKVGNAAEKFDASAIERKDISVMSKKAKMSLDNFRCRWQRSPTIKYSEVLDVTKCRYRNDSDAELDVDGVGMSSLLGLEECGNSRVLQLSLPNGVVMSCPFSIKTNDGKTIKSFEIIMSCETNTGDVQTIQFSFEHAKLKQVRGSTIKVG